MDARNNSRLMKRIPDKRNLKNALRLSIILLAGNSTRELKKELNRLKCKLLIEENLWLMILYYVLICLIVLDNDALDAINTRDKQPIK